MVNTNKISCIETISFQDKIYRTRIVNVKGFGESRIATESLQDALLSDGEYVSENARIIDEDIFFYVEDKYIHCDDQTILAANVYKNVA